jgi:serine/threonine protein phosphatase PrpC
VIIDTQGSCARRKCERCGARGPGTRRAARVFPWIPNFRKRFFIAPCAFYELGVGVGAGGRSHSARKVCAAHIGDSRMLMFSPTRRQLLYASRDHHPQDSEEAARIRKTPIPVHRGRMFFRDYCSLNVCRGFGDR